MIVTNAEGQKVDINVFIEKKKTNGRPKKLITDAGVKLVEDLSRIMCTEEEIATILDTSLDTLHNAENNELFRNAIEKGRANGKQSLRREQYKLAMRGDRGMLIWLGKQYLGQSEKFTSNVESDNAVVMKNYIDNIKGGANE